MKYIRYILLGAGFGIFLTKSEAISWYRMQEMFHFQGFQIFGIFMTAVPTAALSLWLLRRFKVRTLDGEPIHVEPKKYHHGLILGGILFGIGWGLTGACPGPIYAQIGAGYSVAIVILLSAIGATNGSSPPGATLMMRQPIITHPGRERIVLIVPVSMLAATLNGLDLDGLTTPRSG